jgi:hypothetical protein
MQIVPLGGKQYDTMALTNSAFRAPLEAPKQVKI